MTTAFKNDLFEHLARVGKAVSSGKRLQMLKSSPEASAASRRWRG